MDEPVRMMVLWHRECPSGAALARELFNWFRGDPDQPLTAGQGVPIYYRSETPTMDAEPTPCIAVQNTTIYVALIDEHMVVEPAWRRYLKRIAESQCRLIPVALNTTAYQVPAAVRELNFLRLPELDDPSDEASCIQVRSRRLVSLLTQVLARELFLRAAADKMADNRTRTGHGTLSPAEAEDTPPPVSVFISHAKADGLEVAQKLRQAILGRGQLQAFFDESDLPIGYRYSDRLRKSAGSAVDTQAMIAVFSDAYADRPWCAFELRLARTPCRVSDEGDGKRCWRVKPLLLVANLKKAETRMIGEAGYAPLIAWSEHQARRVVDRLLREILFLHYNTRRALELMGKAHKRKAIANLGVKPSEIHALNCPPDAYLASKIVEEMRGKRPRLRQLWVPPPGPSREDRETLCRLLANGDKQVEILSFEEAEAAMATEPLEHRAPQNERQLIGISISETDDLAEHGLGPEHLKEMMITVAHSVLRREALGAGDGDHRPLTGLVYGGDLRANGFTRNLFDIALSETVEPLGGGNKPRDAERRIVNCIAWPYYQLHNKRERAQMINSCHLLNITPRDAGFRDIEADQSPATQDNPSSIYVASRCLSTMRERTTSGGLLDMEGRRLPRLRARILLGGKRSGYASFMPGVYEEFLVSRAPEDGSTAIPVFLIGGFGGASGEMARFVLEPDSKPDKDKPLTLELQLAQADPDGAKQLERLNRLYRRHFKHNPKGDRDNTYVRQRYKMLRDALTALAESVHENSDKRLDNGLTGEENRRLMQTQSAAEVRQFLSKGLAWLLARPAPTNKKES